ncbi:MAG: enoyl-CoA hydratase/isomerase family protein [Kiloniellales bacterium]|nr:enoyl-CoA hydratase/isomerase family protein [Kiloniellales bacterium]
MAAPMFLEEIDEAGIARLVLNRPEVHNAFNDELIAELTAALKRLEQAPEVRAVLLSAQGKSFSAGADLTWMKRMAGYSEEENRADARGLAGLMRTLNDLAKPSIALVQGAAYGGGVGLVACCDIAIAATRSSFCLSEVKLGLIPAVISPYVIAAIGAQAARRYFVTAERFDAEAALRLGLVQEVVAPEDLEAAGRRVLEALLAGGPEAQAAAKRLVRDLAGRQIDDALVEETAKRIAEIRAGAEAKEGVSAFLEKRRPSFVRDKD